MCCWSALAHLDFGKAPPRCTHVRRTFQQRAETFGYAEGRPWANDAFRLLFCVPRAYEPLVKAWDTRHPGTRAALARLVASGFVEYQGPVVMDTRTGEEADRQSPSVTRYRTTAKGRRLLADLKEDLRVLSEIAPASDPQNHRGIARLLNAFDLQDSHARYGLSAGYAIEESQLAPRTGRWWVARFAELGHLRALDVRLADTRAVVPAHWRVTRVLCRQFDEVIEAFPDHADPSLRVEFRLRRGRFLSDIDPARLGISGATDFDHDVECQRVVAAMVGSPRCATEGAFMLEPRLTLSARRAGGRLVFEDGGSEAVFYQPDCEFREQDETGVRRSIVEYERYQSRRDAWAHIERFLGYLSLSAYPSEAAVLHFVVDSEARVRAYRELIEAFCDHALEHPDLLISNPVTLTVTSSERVMGAADPLNPRIWHRIQLPAGGASSRPVLHDPRTDTPYEAYFSRASRLGVGGRPT